MQSLKIQLTSLHKTLHFRMFFLFIEPCNVQTGNKMCWQYAVGNVVSMDRETFSG